MKFQILRPNKYKIPLQLTTKYLALLHKSISTAKTMSNSLPLKYVEFGIFIFILLPNNGPP